MINLLIMFIIIKIIYSKKWIIHSFGKRIIYKKNINKSYERDDNSFKLLSSITIYNFFHKISFPEII